MPGLLQITKFQASHEKSMDEDTVYAYVAGTVMPAVVCLITS